MTLNKSKPKPPAWARKFLAWYCRPELLEDLEGDLHEYFDRNCDRRGSRYARFIYVIDAMKFMRPYLIRKPSLYNIIVHTMMINSYVKTSGRNMIRNKLFTGINLLGLAVSMSVGLILIAFIQQLGNFDQFHEKKDRIYRVVTTTHSMDFATSSVLAGKKIKESFAAVEDVTLLRRGFGGDATVNGSSIPVSGFWADNSFLSVFTFPLVQGDLRTALKEPYSLVLTEETALKVFGKTDVLGQSITFDTTHYIVTGVMQDIPAQSHIRFDILASFATVELEQPDTDGGFMSWGSCFMGVTYVLLPGEAETHALQVSLDQLCSSENKSQDDGNISLSLQPLTQIVMGRSLGNQIGPVMNTMSIAVLVALTFIVILSAVFNYSNLSIARAMRRSREVGIRKVIGASKASVIYQFITESIVIALVSLAFSFGLFFILRGQFLDLHPFLHSLGPLHVYPSTFIWFIVLALTIGLMAGIPSAVFFSRMNAAKVLKDLSSIQLFKRVTMRKALIVVQYVFALTFVTATTIGYTQYKSILAFDLGFRTENILNINLQGNDSGPLIRELKEIPGVQDVSQSLLIMSLGNTYGREFKYTRTGDSSNVLVNYIDENYLSLHHYTLLAGKTFHARSRSSSESEAIVNETLLKQFQIGGGEPLNAIGEEVSVEGQRLTIVGIVKDFHYETLQGNIKPVVFQHFTQANYGYLNVKIEHTNSAMTQALIEKAWKKVDDTHPLQATLYDDQIVQAYSPFTMTLKVVGFLGVLTICISSMGLFGMVVYTTETRRREISIRKIMGATETRLVYLLGKSFFMLLGIAALIAIPLTYLFFSSVVLSKFAYHQPISVTEILVSLSVVTGIALLMIGSQSLTIARANPADTLKEQ